MVVVGECLPKDDSFRRKLQGTLRNAGLEDRVLFLGKQPYKKIPALIRAMSVVTASVIEGFGLTVEAMASGVPVVTSEAGAWKDIVRHGTDGFVCPIGEAKEVSIAIAPQGPGTARENGVLGRENLLLHHREEAEMLTDHLLSLRQMNH